MKCLIKLFFQDIADLSVIFCLFIQYLIKPLAFVDDTTLIIDRTFCIKFFFKLNCDEESLIYMA